MKSLEDQILSYAAYHRNTWNKVSHFFGVPIVIFSLFIPLGWFRFVHADIPLSGAVLFYLGVTIYYLRLDWVIALTQAPISAVLLYFADQVSVMPFLDSLTYFFGSFALGWAIQFLGHVFEGKRPALTDNIMQIFNAPLFLSVEVLFLLGFRKDLRMHVERSLG